MTRLRVSGLGLLALVLSACASTRTTVDRSKGLGEVTHDQNTKDVPIRGHTVRLQLEDGTRIEGELLAVDGDGLLWILERSGLVAVYPGSEVTVQLYDPTFLGWGIAGALSTISHGFFLVLTGPIWLATFLPIAISDRRQSKLVTSSPRELAQFARWPQGLPAAWRKR